MNSRVHILCTSLFIMQYHDLEYMNIETKIWYDLVHTKYGDEYLILYLGRQRMIRKWFKIFSILFSASGIFSAFQSAKIPTIISCVFIGLVQLATSIENFIIHSESDLDELSKLRLLYFERSNKLEQLYYLLRTNKVSIEVATTKFFKLRNSSNQIEELDNKLNIRHYKSLKNKADISVTKYINTYYYE